MRLLRRVVVDTTANVGTIGQAGGREASDASDTMPSFSPSPSPSPSPSSATRGSSGGRSLPSTLPIALVIATFVAIIVAVILLSRYFRRRYQLRRAIAPKVVEWRPSLHDVEVHHEKESLGTWDDIKVSSTTPSRNLMLISITALQCFLYTFVP